MSEENGGPSEASAPPEDTAAPTPEASKPPEGAEAPAPAASVTKSPSQGSAARVAPSGAGSITGVSAPPEPAAAARVAPSGAGLSTGVSAPPEPTAAARVAPSGAGSTTGVSAPPEPAAAARVAPSGAGSSTGVSAPPEPVAAADDGVLPEGADAAAAPTQDPDQTAPPAEEPIDDAPTEGAQEPSVGAGKDGQPPAEGAPAAEPSPTTEGAPAAEGATAAEGAAEGEGVSNVKKVSSGRSVFRIRDQKEYDPFTSHLERRITKLFEALDAEGTGFVDVQELGSLVRSVGCCPSESELQEMVTQLEAEGQPGLITLPTVMPYIVQCVEDRKYPSATPEQLTKAFEVLAEEREEEVHRPGPQKSEKQKEEEKGTIPQDKLVHILTEEGEHFSQEEIEELLSVVSGSDTGRLDYTEFVKQLIVSELW